MCLFDSPCDCLNKRGLLEAQLENGGAPENVWIKFEDHINDLSKMDQREFAEHRVRELEGYTDRMRRDHAKRLEALYNQLQATHNVLDMVLQSVENPDRVPLIELLEKSRDEIGLFL